MKTKVFDPGAICAAVALLLVLSLPAYAKSGGSTASHARAGKTSTNATGGVKPLTSSKVRTTNETKKIKSQLSPVETQIGTAIKNNEKIKGKETTEQARLKSQQEKSGSIQKNLDATTDKQREMNKTINCLANC